MVRFLSASAIGKIVNRVGRDRFWLQLIDYLERDFRRWESFEKAPRLASHSKDGVIELMPTTDGETYCFKFVNGHPKNTRRGLQTVAAFGVLADVATGYPRLLADMTLATAFRTAAVSALAARYLARRESETMALIGLGAQSEFQACAFQAALGVNRLRIHDVDPAAAEKFLRNMADSGLSIIRCASAQTPSSERTLSPRSPRTNKGRRFFPTTWSAPERTSTRSGAIARARPNSRETFFCARRFSWNTRRKRVWKARSSN